MIEAEIVQLIEHHRIEMEAWASGHKSYTNTFHPDQALVAILDTQEVIKHSAAIQAYAALLSVPARVSGPTKPTIMRDSALREELYEVNVAALRDRVVMINHAAGYTYNVNIMSKGELITAIVEHCTLQEIIDFLQVPR